MNNAPKIKYNRGGANMHKTKAIFYEKLESKLHDTGRYLTNPHGFKTPIFSTLKQGSIPGARKKIK